jgi:hypothetical protein
MFHLCKAQTFSADFLMACVVFVLAFSILFIYWNYATLELEESRKINQMIDRAYLISGVWFREGIPKYWNASNVLDIGLSNDHRFNSTKMNSLNDSSFLGYERVRSKIGIEDYDFYFRVYNTSGAEIFSFGSEPLNPKNLVKIRRLGLLDNGTIAIVEVMVWE